MVNCKGCKFYVNGYKKGNVRKLEECGFVYPREVDQLPVKGRLFDNRNQSCKNYKGK
jgi:hypothetical protein